ncbi:MAG: DUF4194 domain-containing protein [Spirochaetia bacterium]
MSTELSSFAPIVIKLLKGVMYKNDPSWEDLLTMENAVSRYLGQIGIELHIDQMEGFAFVRQPDPNQDDETAQNMPRLVRRIPLSFEVSLLCVILREELETFDASLPEFETLYITKEQMRERLRIYFKEKADETRLFRELDRYIKNMEDLGFLKKLSDTSRLENSDRYEVKRIIKAKINLDFIQEFKDKLEDYIGTL